MRGAPTPQIDELAKEGLRLTQFLVEPACTPSRAALMTGQYSIRDGLSLIIIPGSDATLSARAYTMGDMFHGLGYATAIFGKWHLGGEPQSLPTAHGFDEFYGIPPDISWDSATYVDTEVLTHSFDAPRNVLLEKGPHMVELVLGGPGEVAAAHRAGQRLARAKSGEGSARWRASLSQEQPSRAPTASVGERAFPAVGGARTLGGRSWSFIDANSPPSCSGPRRA